DALAAGARDDLEAQGVAPERIEVLRRAHLRYQGTDTAIAVALGTPAAMRAAFEEAYRKRFAFLMPSRSLVIEAASVEAIGRGEETGGAADMVPQAAPREGALRAEETTRLFSGGCWRDAPLYRRDDTRPGDVMAGPAIIAEKNQTTIVEPGWRAEVTSQGHLVLARAAARPAAAAGDGGAAAAAAACDPVKLEVFANLFMS